MRARERHIELLADVPRDLPRALRGDPTRLRQILTNLISNAIKFTEEGEVVVSIVVDGTDDGIARITFSVRDTGIGIAPEQLQMIFGEFAQADVSMTRRYGGTGLGLAISQRLVRLMGGELGVTSEKDRGSDFHLPLALPVEPDEALLAPGRGALGGRRVLVVDDNPTNRRILREMLAAEGMTVDEASSAAAGLVALHGAVEQEARYDLAILDVQMPDRDGFEFAKEIRTDPSGGRHPAAHADLGRSAGRWGAVPGARHRGVSHETDVPRGPDRSAWCRVRRRSACGRPRGHYPSFHRRIAADAPHPPC